MPVRQPFTALCQALARGRSSGRADLHLHSVHSDGTYTPAQLVDLARRSGLATVALTDHDTLAGIAEMRAAAGSIVEVIAGVEISTVYQGRELHLLAYFVRLEDEPLRGALERLQRHREERFWEMVERLRGCGVSIDEQELRAGASGALGRRYLAEFLVKTGQAGSLREVFRRYLGDGGRATVPKVRLPVAEALALVHGAGGVASWAHPSYDGFRDNATELRRLGLDAVEVEYPSIRPGRRRELRCLAGAMGLAVTGGSDCHGPGQAYRSVGACSVTAEELGDLRKRSRVGI